MRRIGILRNPGLWALFPLNPEDYRGCFCVFLGCLQGCSSVACIGGVEYQCPGGWHHACDLRSLCCPSGLLVFHPFVYDFCPSIMPLLLVIGECLFTALAAPSFVSFYDGFCSLWMTSFWPCAISCLLSVPGSGNNLFSLP